MRRSSSRTRLPRHCQRAVEMDWIIAFRDVAAVNSIGKESQQSTTKAISHGRLPSRCPSRPRASPDIDHGRCPCLYPVPAGSHLGAFGLQCGQDTGRLLPPVSDCRPACPPNRLPGRPIATPPFCAAHGYTAVILMAAAPGFAGGDGARSSIHCSHMAG
jgi:hypothetical protein